MTNTERSPDAKGAVITHGPADWQIIQRGPDGLGSIALQGRWASDEPGRVEARLAYEDSGAPVARHLDWRPAVASPNGTWALTLEGISAGGLYRLETRFNPRSNPAAEWSLRGDMRHCLGVGDVWIIAGQSNSAGYGRGPVYDPPELGLHLFGNDMRWSLATHPLNDSTNTRHAVNSEASNPGHAPHLHFARLLKQQLGYPIGLVQTSRGGSALSEWSPGDPATPPALFDNMLRCVRQAGGRVSGLLWYQGESESEALRSADYCQRFERAVAEWRQALEAPALPVLTAQLNRCHMPAGEKLQRSWTMLREAQRQAARRIPGVAVTPTFDLPLSDGIHTSPAGNLVLADRLACLALGSVYGREVDHLAPEVQSARVSDDGRTVILNFSPVTSRMGNVDPTANCFRVEDDNEVPIVEVAYPGGPLVQLVLERPLSGRAVVHGGYGIAPASVPIDVERLMPMLGFYGLAVD